MIDLLKFVCLCRSIFFLTAKNNFVTVLSDCDYGHVLHAMRIKLVRSQKKKREGLKMFQKRLIRFFLFINICVPEHVNKKL